MHPTLINQQSEIKIPRQFILLWMASLSQALKPSLSKTGLNLRKSDITLVFLSPMQMKQINKEFRGKNYATDVLSFSADAMAAKEGSLGELLLCPEVIVRQAKEHELSFKAELGYMLIHGVLHLLGYDHEKSKAEARKMFSLQDQIFDKLCGKFKI